VSNHLLAKTSLWKTILLRLVGAISLHKLWGTRGPQVNEEAILSSAVKYPTPTPRERIITVR